MKKVFIFLLMIAALVLTACTAEVSTGTAGGSINVYRLVRPEYRTDGELIRAETIPIDEDSDAVKGAAFALKRIPDDPELMSCFSQGVGIS